MTFEEIFNEKGLYVADGFAQGACLEVGEFGFLSLLKYRDKDDLFPEKTPAPIYAGLFKKDYKKVFTIQSLFK